MMRPLTRRAKGFHGDREAPETLKTLGARLDDGRDELQQEARHLEQRGVEVVEEVHDEALDVRAVCVLVGHDHEVAVAQLLGALVHLPARAGRSLNICGCGARHALCFVSKISMPCPFAGFCKSF